MSISDDDSAEIERLLGLLRLPVRPAERHIPVKRGCFECRCGCGLSFEATYRTRHPRYLNAAHRMRAYRARKRGTT
jgi:hypothetical protein